MSAVTVGFVGLGSMGLGMARNVLRAGIPVRGYDIVAEARGNFAEAGGEAVESAAEAAAGADVLLLMVVDEDQARDVLFGAGGAVAAMRGRATVVLCSTVSPKSVDDLASETAAAGLWFLDAPVSGGKVGADAGTLTVMAAGSESAFEAARPVLDAISGRVHHVGDKPGLGAVYKVVHQLAAGVHLVAAAELLALGAKAGCDPKTLFEIVSQSAGSSWMFNDRVPRMLDGDHEPRSMVDIFVKDLGLVLGTGARVGSPVPLAAAAHRMLLDASIMGHGKIDDSAVVKVYEAAAGITVSSAPAPAQGNRDSDRPESRPGIPID